MSQTTKGWKPVRKEEKKPTNECKSIVCGLAGERIVNYMIDIIERYTLHGIEAPNILESELMKTNLKKDINCFENECRPHLPDAIYDGINLAISMQKEDFEVALGNIPKLKKEFKSVYDKFGGYKSTQKRK